MLASEVGGHDGVGIRKREAEISCFELIPSELRLTEVTIVDAVIVDFESFATVGLCPNDVREAGAVLVLILDDWLPDSSK